MTTSAMRYGRSTSFILASVLFCAIAAAPPAEVQTIATLDHPFMALPSTDGAVLFVSVARERAANGILVVHRSANAFRVGGFIPIDGQPTGLALTPDGKTLLVAASDRYAALSAVAAARDEKPQVAYLVNRHAGGAIEVVSSNDGSFAFFTNERDDSIGVVKIDETSDATPRLSYHGRVPTDHAPVGLALSPDGKYLYVTSELASGRPRSCINGRPQGSVAVVDVAAAETTPERAVVSSADAGCSPVRVAASPDGRLVWVTQRGDGCRGGLLAFVANSDRFDRSERSSTVDVVDTTKGLAGGSAIVTSYPTGAFPRELREAPQHDVVYLTNYNAGIVEVLPIP